MRDLIDEIHEHLEAVERGTLPPEGSATYPGDLANSQLLRVLERWVASRPDDTGLPSIVIQIHADWRGERVVAFANRLVELARQSFAARASRAELERYVEVTLARHFGLEDGLPSPLLTAELDELGAEAARDTSGVGVDIERYLREVRAVRPTPSALTITALGAPLRELVGRDAVRWLLHLEVAQSLGLRDPWRLSSDGASWLLASPFQIYYRAFGAGDEPAVTWPSLWRLQRLQVVEIVDHSEGPTRTVTVTPLGRQLLAEVATPSDSPLALLVRARLDDLTFAAAHGADEAAARAVAVEATTRQARLVAHEIRNALVPVKTALSSLYRALPIEPQAEVIARLRPPIDRGIQSAFRFVDELTSVARLAATPFDTFQPGPALADAVAQIVTEAPPGLRPEVVTTDALPPLFGPRPRFVNALVNVLRNAAQAVPADAPRLVVTVEARPEGAGVRIVVDDNGPGVPEAMRHAIFSDGVSLRSGGSGLGLALVREVVEGEMRGTVACTAGPLGGARFVLTLPAARGTP